jgi:hypothetical protein
MQVFNAQPFNATTSELYFSFIPVVTLYESVRTERRHVLASYTV